MNIKNIFIYFLFACVVFGLTECANINKKGKEVQQSSTKATEGMNISHFFQQIIYNLQKEKNKIDVEKINYYPRGLKQLIDNLIIAEENIAEEKDPITELLNKVIYCVRQFKMLIDTQGKIVEPNLLKQLNKLDKQKEIIEPKLLQQVIHNLQQFVDKYTAPNNSEFLDKQSSPQPSPNLPSPPIEPSPNQLFPIEPSPNQLFPNQLLTRQISAQQLYLDQPHRSAQEHLAKQLSAQQIYSRQPHSSAQELSDINNQILRYLTTQQLSNLQHRILQHPRMHETQPLLGQEQRIRGIPEGRVVSGRPSRIINGGSQSHNYMSGTRGPGGTQ